MKPLVLLVTTVLVTTLPALAQRRATVTTDRFQKTITSPDGRVALTVTAGERVHYVVSYAGKPLVEPSVVSMTLADGRVLGRKVAVRSSRVRAVRDSIVAVAYAKRRVVRDQYTELTVTFRNNFALDFRAYDDGVAYRFRTTLPDSITIQREEAQFTLVGNPLVFYPPVKPRTDADRFHTSFEEPYQVQPLAQMPDTALCFSPVLITADTSAASDASPNDVSPNVVVTESDLLDYPGMFLQRSGHALVGTFAPYPLEERLTAGEFPQRIVTRRAGYIARTRGTRPFPWRVLVIGNDRTLPGTDLVYRLATPSRVPDVSWIRPGQCTDEWIIGINLFNVPFRAGINTATYKYYVDFAKRFGLERILLDAGWSDYLDLTKINPDLNMDELAAYARQQGIGLSLWTLASTLDRQLEPALAQFRRWGVDFIMTDFMDRDDQPMVNFYQRVAEACARQQIMVMYHGAFKPAGFERTYPHAVTREGVLGSEYNLWSHKATPDHNVLQAFIRMVSGPLDYEPGFMDNAQKRHFRPIDGKPMSQGTRCHQLAMFVVYDSPIQIFSGNPSMAQREPAYMELLGSLPTQFDDTRVLDARLGHYVVTARRRGTDWYVGGLTNWRARDLTLPLSFLPDGTYEATLCIDGPNADRSAVDYVLSTRTVTHADQLPVHLAPGGGFVWRFRKR